MNKRAFLQMSAKTCFDTLASTKAKEFVRSATAKDESDGQRLRAIPVRRDFSNLRDRPVSAQSAKSLSSHKPALRE